MSKIFSNIIQKIEIKAETLTQTHSKDGMRGLTTFITDIRHCKSREAETKRVNKELANIRSQFRADKNLDGYHKKKYVAKLIFISLMGYEVNFGRSEAIFLLCSNRFSEKQIGYLFLSILLDTDDDQFCKTMVNALSADLRSHNQYFVLLAAHCIPNVMCKEIISEIGNDMKELLNSSGNNDVTSQCLLSCYLAMIRFDPQYFKQNQVLNDQLLRLSATANDALLLPLAHIFYWGSQMTPQIFQNSYAGLLSQIQTLCRYRAGGSNHVYYGIQSPWTIMKLLQCVQEFPLPPNMENQLAQALMTVISLGKTTNPDSKAIHGHNIANGLVFEAINVMAAKQIGGECLESAVKFLGAILLTSVNNYKYFALDAFLKIKDLPEASKIVSQHMNILRTIITNESNTTLRLKAGDVIYALCDPSMIRWVVDIYIDFLRSSELSIRAELTMKISMMALKNMVEDTRWFVETMMSVLEYAGRESSEEIWYRIVHVAANYPAASTFAVELAFNYLNKSNIPERLVKLCAYLIGEYGFQLLSRDPEMPRTAMALLLGFFSFVENDTKYVIMAALTKLAHHFASIQEDVRNFFQSTSLMQNIDCEIQQRACEFYELSKLNQAFVSGILDKMPEYSIDDVLQPRDMGSASQSELLGMGDSEDYNMSDEYIINDLNGAPFQIANSNVSLFRLTNEGYLHTNRDIRVAYKMDFNGAMGEVDIYFEDSARRNVPIPIIKAETAPHDGLNLLATIIKTNILKIQFQCFGIYTIPPTVQVSYMVDNVQRDENLALPVYLERFYSPFPVESGRFVAIWNSLNRPEAEAQTQVRLPAGASPNYFESLLKSIKCSIIKGVDNNPNNVVATGLFNSTNEPVGFALRIEVDSGFGKLTVRSVSPMISSVLTQSFSAIIEASVRT